MRGPTQQPICWHRARNGIALGKRLDRSGNGLEWRDVVTLVLQDGEPLADNEFEKTHRRRLVRRLADHKPRFAADHRHHRHARRVPGRNEYAGLEALALHQQACRPSAVESHQKSPPQSRNRRSCWRAGGMQVECRLNAG